MNFHTWVVAFLYCCMSAKLFFLCYFLKKIHSFCHNCLYFVLRIRHTVHSHCLNIFAHIKIMYYLTILTPSITFHLARFILHATRINFGLSLCFACVCVFFFCFAPKYLTQYNLCILNVSIGIITYISFFFLIFIHLICVYIYYI